MLVFTDKSYFFLLKWEGHSGGFGIYSNFGFDASQPKPLNHYQTNNTAELLSFIKSLRVEPVLKIAIGNAVPCMIVGAAGAARYWKVRGWIGGIQCTSLEGAP